MVMIADTALQQLAEELLVANFPPRLPGTTTASLLGAKMVDLELAQINAALKELTALGFLEESPPAGAIREPLYSLSPKGWRQRELILHRRGWRKECLLRQREYSLDDLIVALAMFPIIANRRMKGGFLGTEPEVWEEELKTYLFLYDPDEVLRAAEHVIELGLLSERILPDGRLFAIEPMGEREYTKRICKELRLRPEETILDEDHRNIIRIFYAWQSDHNTSRTHIGEALRRIATTANSEWKALAPIIIEMATDVGDGAVRIDLALMEKIARADCVVADSTPVAVHKSRLLPNPNILIEIGYALASKPAEQVILIEHSAHTKTLLAEDSAARLPFDIDHVHRVRYDAPAELRKRLESEIRQLLQRLGRLN